MTNKDNRTASQRIEDLEKATMSVFQVFNQMGQDVGTLKEAIKLLGNKISSVVKAINSGQSLTDEVISQIMIENNVEELRGRVEQLKQQGFFVAQESIQEDSFVVGREFGLNGEVAQPRMQFGFSALQPEVKEKLKGAKPGDIIDFGENKNKFEVLETYAVIDPNAPATSLASEATVAPELSNEVPQVEQTEAAASS